MILLAGSCVTHARMPELGSGEILGSEDGKVRIRFASGDKSFLLERAAEHLKITSEAPVLPPAKPARRATNRKTKA